MRSLAPVATLLAFVVARPAHLRARARALRRSPSGSGVKVLRFSIGFGPVAVRAARRRDRVRALRHAARRLREDARRGRRRRGARAEPRARLLDPAALAARRDRHCRPGDELPLRVPGVRDRCSRGRCRGALEPAARRRRRGGLGRGEGRTAGRRSRSSRSTAAPIATWEELSQAVRRRRTARRSRSRSTRDGRRAPGRGHARAARTSRTHLRRGAGKVVPHRHRGVARLDTRSGRCAGGRHGREQTWTASVGRAPRGCSSMVQGRVPLRGARRADRDRARGRPAGARGMRVLPQHARLPLDQPRRAEPAADPGARRRPSRVLRGRGRVAPPAAAARTARSRSRSGCCS